MIRYLQNNTMNNRIKGLQNIQILRGLFYTVTPGFGNNLIDTPGYVFANFMFP